MCSPQKQKTPRYGLSGPSHLRMRSRLYVLNYQPAKFAAIEARWKTQQPASQVLIALPDPFAERNLFAIEIPKLGSFIASGNWTAREIGLETFPTEDRPPVIIPFFAFRIMVGMGASLSAHFPQMLRIRLSATAV